MTPHHPTSYHLGQHTVELLDDEGITIVNERIAVQLEHEEVYRLYLVLRELFMHSDQPGSVESQARHGRSPQGRWPQKRGGETVFPSGM
jgi:hypothetical protein